MSEAPSLDETHDLSVPKELVLYLARQSTVNLTNAVVSGIDKVWSRSVDGELPPRCQGEIAREVKEGVCCEDLEGESSRRRNPCAAAVGWQ